MSNEQMSQDETDELKLVNFVFDLVECIDELQRDRDIAREALRLLEMAEARSLSSPCLVSTNACAAKNCMNCELYATNRATAAYALAEAEMEGADE